MVLYCMYCSIDLSLVTKQLRSYHYFCQHGMQLAELEQLNISPTALYHEPFHNPVPGEPHYDHFICTVFIPYHLHYCSNPDQHIPPPPLC